MVTRYGCALSRPILRRHRMSNLTETVHTVALTLVSILIVGYLVLLVIAITLKIAPMN